MADQLSSYAGKPVNTAALDNEINELDGMGTFSSVSYSVVKKDGKQGLQIEPQPKPYSPPIVRPLILINGADAQNVFWQVGSAATLGTTTIFAGTIMAQSSITLNTGAVLNGRALARTGAVSLDSNPVNVPACLGIP